jgi:hypothetical protein
MREHGPPAKKEGRYETQEIRDLTDFEVGGRLGNLRTAVSALRLAQGGEPVEPRNRPTLL